MSSPVQCLGPTSWFSAHILLDQRKVSPLDGSVMHCLRQVPANDSSHGVCLRSSRASQWFFWMILALFGHITRIDCRTRERMGSPLDGSFHDEIAFAGGVLAGLVLNSRTSVAGLARRSQFGEILEFDRRSSVSDGVTNLAAFFLE